jgi:hypothetical protein
MSALTTGAFTSNNDSGTFFDSLLYLLQLISSHRWQSKKRITL